jgi:hypothetical protein
MYVAELKIKSGEYYYIYLVDNETICYNRESNITMDENENIGNIIEVRENLYQHDNLVRLEDRREEVLQPTEVKELVQVQGDRSE